MKKNQKFIEQEKLAQQLASLDVRLPSKRHLLRSSLSKLDDPSYTGRIVSEPILRSSAISRMIFYVPTALVGIVVVSLVFTGSIRNSQVVINSSNVATSPKTKPNGSIENAVTAISADATSETLIDKQAISEAVTSASQITSQASTLTEVSNEKGL